MLISERSSIEEWDLEEEPRPIFKVSVPTILVPPWVTWITSENPQKEIQDAIEFYKNLIAEKRDKGELTRTEEWKETYPIVVEKLTLKKEKLQEII